jgi:hypothetical protein
VRLRITRYNDANDTHPNSMAVEAVCVFVS